MRDDERIIEDLKTLRKIEWSKCDTEVVWKRLENQITEDCGNDDSLGSQTIIYHRQFHQNSEHEHSLDRLSANHRNPISMGGQQFKPNGGNGQS